MKYTFYILGITFFALMSSCRNDWEEHYTALPATSNMNVWEALQKEPTVSSFVEYLKEYQYDTLFLTNNSYTIFAPTNEAFTQFLQSDSITGGVLAYHISKFFVQTQAIEGKRKIQTFSEKFALFNSTPAGAFLDDIPLQFESSLFKNGKYYIINQVAIPKPNLYEYIALTNPVLKNYIDSEDSLFLNKAESTPIGFDEYGNTIYDTVAEIINMFELEFFPVSEEYRHYTATLVFPKEENYNEALTKMAQTMNAGYNSYEDIPIEWQNEVLIPYLLERGVFMNMIEREEFIRKAIRDTVKLKNILGDSVVIDYEPELQPTICSNGYAYNYGSFVVPDTLYKSPTFYEGEWLLETVGHLTFNWSKGVENISDAPFSPLKEFNASASNDTIFRVYFSSRYAGRYSVEFNVDNLFPRKYLARVRTVMRVGGLYEIYVNDQLVRTFDYAVYNQNGGIVNSVHVPDKYYPQPQGYNRFDFWIDNLTEYGTAKIRFEYKGPSTVTTNGLVLDYIQFVPHD